MDLCKAMGGEAGTISGLSGIGDLMLTAFGSLSRNRTTGVRIAKGESIEDITAMTTVEGVPTAQVAVFFADQCGLELPIFRAVAAVLKGTLKIDELHLHLMGRPLKQETETNLQRSMRG
jgi:glycerol-3-phosphate dehydrogenase (NAD+)